MLEEMVKAVVNKVIAQDYPFLKSSAALYAVVTKAKQLGETFDYNDLVIVDDEVEIGRASCRERVWTYV